MDPLDSLAPGPRLAGLPRDRPADPTRRRRSPGMPPARCAKPSPTCWLSSPTSTSSFTLHLIPLVERTYGAPSPRDPLAGRSAPVKTARRRMTSAERPRLGRTSFPFSDLFAGEDCLLTPAISSAGSSHSLAFTLCSSCAIDVTPADDARDLGPGQRAIAMASSATLLPRSPGRRPPAFRKRRSCGL